MCVHMGQSVCVHMRQAVCVHMRQAVCVHVRQAVCVHMRQVVCVHMRQAVCVHMRQAVCGHMRQAMCVCTHETGCVYTLTKCWCWLVGWGTGGIALAGAATSIIFVVTKHVFCRDKSMLAATKLRLSRQLCLFFTFVATNISCDKSFVATSILLSRQKTCFVATNTCLS